MSLGWENKNLALSLSKYAYSSQRIINENSKTKGESVISRCFSQGQYLLDLYKSVLLIYIYWCKQAYQPTVWLAVCAREPFTTVLSKNVAYQVLARAVHCLAFEPPAWHNETWSNAFRIEPSLLRPTCTLLFDLQAFFKRLKTVPTISIL